MDRPVIDHTSFELVTIDPPNPAVASPYTFIVPAHTVIQTIGLTFILATDANVANRRVYLHAGTGAVYWARVMSSVDQPANDTMYYYFILGPIDPFYSAPQNQAQFPLFDNVFLYPTERFSIAIYDTQAGDQLSDIHIGYKRWILE